MPDWSKKIAERRAHEHRDTTATPSITKAASILPSATSSAIWCAKCSPIRCRRDVLRRTLSGHANAHNFCHCQYCEAAYQKKFGKPVPDQYEGKVSQQDEIQYTNWMAQDVAIAFFREIREMIRSHPRRARAVQ